MEKSKKQKGFILITTLIFTFVMMATTAAIFSVAYRYVNIVKDNEEELRKEVYDGEANTVSLEMVGISDDCNWSNI